MAEAAVIAIPHQKWGERPLLCVVLKEDCSLTKEEMLQHFQVCFSISAHDGCPRPKAKHVLHCMTGVALQCHAACMQNDVRPSFSMR